MPRDIRHRFRSGAGAVVTGAAQGLGKAIAERLLSEGVDVLLVDRQADVLGETMDALDHLGTAHQLVADIVEDEAPAQIHDAAQDLLDNVSILVNNAGIAGSDQVDQLSEGRWNEVLDVNLTGAFRLAKQFVPSMVDDGYGRIICMSSMTGIDGFRRSSDYAVSKAGLVALTRSLAVDYGPFGVTANAVAPGAIATPLAERMLSSRPRWYLRAMLELKPVKRIGTPEDVAAAVAFLASDESGYITGQTLVVDGGLTATRFVPDLFEGET